MGDAYAGVYSQYLWRGIDFSGNMPVLQGGMDLSAAGFTLSYWSNFQMIGDAGGAPALDAGEMTETDLVLDYTKELTDLVSVSVGNIYYTFNVPGATNELYLGVALNTLLSPELKMYWDWDKASSADRAGLFYTLGVSHTFALTDMAGLNLGALVSYNDENVGSYTDFHNYELTASVDYSPMENLTITPALLYSDGISSDARDAIDSKLVSSLSVSYAF